MSKIIVAVLIWAFQGLIGNILIAQQANPSMLWRLEHPGQAKPSYIYMVPSDNREQLFHFPDSLFAALRQTEQFFQLFSPTELTRIILESINTDGTIQSVMLKEAVSGQLWPSYAPLLQNKFGKPAESITLWEAIDYFSKLKKGFDPESPFFTTADLYLFEYAHRLSKPVNGLWQLRNSDGKLFMPLLENDLQWLTSDVSNAKAKKITADFIDAYLQGDISALKTICSCQQEDDLFFEKELGQLARAIDSVAAIKSSLFVIPVGYLFGAKTIFDFLPQHITLVPVQNFKRVSPDQSPLPSAFPHFTTVTDQLYNLFSAKMPGEYFNKKFEETMEMHFGADFFEETSFCIFSFPATVEASEKKQFAEWAAQEFSGVKKLPKASPVSKDGISGWEYRLTENKIKVIRLQVFITGEHMIIAMSTRENKNIPSSYEEDFFNEIKFHEKQSH